MALMFESLTTRLNGVLDRLKRRGALSEDDVVEAMREIRIALLEADVALPVVKDLVARVRERAVGQEVIKSITPGQMVVKIVHDELVAILGADGSELSLGAPPAVVLMAGLQGSGKTTTSAKLARRLRLQGAQEGAAGLARHAAPGGPDAARGAGAPVRGREPADRRRPAGAGDHPPRAGDRPPRGLRRPDPRHRRPAQHRRRADGRAGRRSATSPGRTRPCWSPMR